MAKRQKPIPFNKPAMVGREQILMEKAVKSGKISGNGEFTQKAQELLCRRFGYGRVFLTTSCTDALEMTALLLDLRPGDEVIVPSFGFVSTVNAFVLRGATPVFVDIRPDTLNLDESLIEKALTKKTRVIVPIHYAGVGAEMDPILSLADDRGIHVVEDAAQGINAWTNGRALGSLAPLAAISFHETKNIHCGEGGALIVNDSKFYERAEILWEKGTNRAKFFRGQVDKYTWVDVGSSFLISDLQAAYLTAQLEKLNLVHKKRLRLYKRYAKALANLESRGKALLPYTPHHCDPNGHIFYLLLENEGARDSLIGHLRKNDIHAVFHYLPLHLSPMGKKLGKKKARCPITEQVSARIVRLPLYYEMSDEDQDRVIQSVLDFFEM